MVKMAKGYPGMFDPVEAKKFINGTQNAINDTCSWDSTPQGHDYWYRVYIGHSPITDEHRKIVQDWLDAYNIDKGIAPPSSHNPNYDVFDPKNWGL